MSVHADQLAYRRSKRLLDVGLVLLSLPVVIPLIAVIAVAIKLEDRSNPVFFTQTRTGRDGHPFRMFKFATMVKNA